MGHGAYPDNEEYGMKCVKEAEVLVRRLRHHASLLMWCGGNETIMGAELIGKYPFGDWIAKSAFPEMLRRLDPRDIIMLIHRMEANGQTIPEKGTAIHTNVYGNILIRNTRIFSVKVSEQHLRPDTAWKK